MKINIKNIVSEYPKIKQSLLPDALKKVEFDFVSENLDLYNDDADIKNYIDTFVLKLNEVVSKTAEKNKSVVAKKKASTKKTNDLASKIAEINNKKTSQKTKSVSVKKTTSKKRSSVSKKKDTSKKVGNVDLQVTFIKSFVLMHGKEKTKKQILNLYKRIEKAAVELRIRKTSKYAKQIMYVSNFLVKLYNDAEGNVETIINVDIPTKNYNELYEIAYSEKQKKSISLIKRYIGMYGLEYNEKTKKRAFNLHNAIYKAFDSSEIHKGDSYYKEIKEIETNLEAFLLQNGELFPESFDLRGLSGLAGIEIPKKKTLAEKKQVQGEGYHLPATSFNKEEKHIEKLGKITLPSAYEIAQKSKREAEYFKIDNKVGGFLGKIEKKPKHSVVVTLDAPQGAGKTRALFQFANALAKHGNTVLFASFEEHPESTLFQKKQKQYISNEALKYFYPIGEISGYEELAKLMSQFDVVMIDSWNKIKQMSPHVDFDTDFRKAYDGKLFFTIFQRTQDGKMRGGSQAQFDGDIILKVGKREDFKENYLFADKNRYQDKDLNSLFYNVYHQEIITENPDQRDERLKKEEKEAKKQKE